MTKKEFEKETYLAPQWGMRVVHVERHYLTGESDKDPNVNEDDVVDDDNSWTNQ